MTIKACVFDAYGTLFDVAAAARNAAAEPGNEKLAEVWQKLSETWRQKQLEYSWLRAVAMDYKSFWDVTTDALDYSMEVHGLEDLVLRETLLGLYYKLDAYPEVPAMLAALKEQGLVTGILSNGSPDMLEGAVSAAGIGDNLDHVLSVASVGVFKPHRSVYELAEQATELQREEIAFFSSNGWDVTHAARHGFHAIWVNRSGAPLDRVGKPPAQIISDLSGVPTLVG